MNTAVLDATDRLFRQFGVESRHDTSNNVLEPLQNGIPYTPPNISEIESAVAAWLPLDLIAQAATVPADNATPAVIAVRSPGSPSVTLDVSGQLVSVPLVDGIGTLEIAPRSVPTQPPHIIIKSDAQTVYGYGQIAIRFE